MPSLCTPNSLLGSLPFSALAPSHKLCSGPVHSLRDPAVVASIGERECFSSRVILSWLDSPPALKNNPYDFWKYEVPRSSAGACRVLRYLGGGGCMCWERRCGDKLGRPDPDTFPRPPALCGAIGSKAQSPPRPPPQRVKRGRPDIAPHLLAALNSQRHPIPPRRPGGSGSVVEGRELGAGNCPQAPTSAWSTK